MEFELHIKQKFVVKIENLLNFTSEEKVAKFLVNKYLNEEQWGWEGAGLLRTPFKKEKIACKYSLEPQKGIKIISIKRKDNGKV